MIVPSSVTFTPGSVSEYRSGLLGYITFRLGDSLQVDGVAVRRTQSGRLTLSFPARRDRHGHDHAYIRPLDDLARKSIETQIFDALSLRNNSERNR